MKRKPLIDRRTAGITGEGGYARIPLEKNTFKLVYNNFEIDQGCRANPDNYAVYHRTCQHSTRLPGLGKSLFPFNNLKSKQMR